MVSVMLLQRCRQSIYWMLPSKMKNVGQKISAATKQPSRPAWRQRCLKGLTSRNWLNALLTCTQSLISYVTYASIDI